MACQSEARGIAGITVTVTCELARRVSECMPARRINVRLLEHVSIVITPTTNFQLN